MEIKVNRLSMIDALSVGGSMAGRAKSLEILKCAKCSVSDGKMIVSSFDTETAVLRYFGVNFSDSDGEFCVYPKDLISMLRSINDDDVTITVDETTCTVTHERGTVEIPVLPAVDFPTVGRDEHPFRFRVDKCADFVSWLKKAKCFVVNNEARPIFSGVYIYLKNGEFGVASSNITAMFTNHIECEQPEGEIDDVLSTKAINTLIEILDGENMLDVSVGKNNIMFTTSNSRISCLKLVGRFPNFKSVFPKSHSVEFKVNKEDFISSLERAIFSANEASKLLQVSVSGNSVSIDSQNLMSSKRTHESCPCELSGEDIKFGVNGKLLLDCFNAIDSESVLVEMNAKHMPIVLKDEDDDNQDILLMPMALPNSK